MILILASLICQAGFHHKTNRENWERLRRNCKDKLSTGFYPRAGGFWNDVQKLQQDNRCCGVDGPSDYESWRSDDYIPPSCCGKYEKDSRDLREQRCSARELEGVRGCGDLLVDLYAQDEEQKYPHHAPGGFLNVLDFLFVNQNVILYILKSLAIVLTFTLISSINGRAKNKQNHEMPSRILK